MLPVTLTTFSKFAALTFRIEFVCNSPELTMLVEFVLPVTVRPEPTLATPDVLNVAVFVWPLVTKLPECTLDVTNNEFPTFTLFVTTKPEVLVVPDVVKFPDVVLPVTPRVVPTVAEVLIVAISKSDVLVDNKFICE